MKLSKEIHLLSGSRVVGAATVDAYFGKRSFHNSHDDAKYLSDPRFRLFRSPKGQWKIEHVASAKNETLVDGRSFTGATVLASRMTISVGNPEMGIPRFPLTIEIDTVDGMVRKL